MLRPLTVVAMLALTIPYATLAETARGADCELVAQGSVQTVAGPASRAHVILYDIRTPGPVEGVTSANDPSANRDTPAKRVLAQGPADDLGAFSFCIAAADEPTGAGTVDLALAVQAQTPCVIVYTPGIVTATADPFTPGFLFPDRREAIVVYTAYSPEFRNAAPGVFDFGAFAPNQPATPIDPPPAPPGGGPGELCFEGGPCIDGAGNVAPVSNPTAGAFLILARIERGYARVVQLEQAANPGGPRAPPHVTVHFPQGACGAGCYSAAQNTIATQTAAEGVVLHEYGHHIQAHFGPVNSPGGGHTCGAGTDPGLAWSEGFADFFPALVTGLATSGHCGDAERVPGGQAGQGNEANVQNALWDFQDDTPGEDAIASSPERFWDAFITQPGDATYAGFEAHWATRFPADEEAARSVSCHNRMAFITC